MARRPIYIPRYNSEIFVETIIIDFTWHPGMSFSQKQKSIEDLHKSAIRNNICSNPLEVSSKSKEEIGVSLSAFNLEVTTEKHGRKFTVETAFQSSKVFKNGGPYKDLLYGSSINAKKDPRIKDSGEIIGFNFFGVDWPTEPKTAFYDFIYINALRKNKKATAELEKYDAFTDIEFNPEKSINCQAYSVALYKALKKRNLLDTALNDKDSFLTLISKTPTINTHENTLIQPNLF